MAELTEEQRNDLEDAASAVSNLYDRLTDARHCSYGNEEVLQKIEQAVEATQRAGEKVDELLA